MAFKAYGPLSISADRTVNLPLTNATIEPAAIESGPDIPVYTDRAAYSTTASPFLNPLYVNGEARITVTVSGPNGVLFQRSITMEKEYTAPATRTCTSPTPSPGGGPPQQTCTYSCSTGRLIGQTCYWYIFANSGGICLVVDPSTGAYAGPCAIMDSSAASLLSSAIVPNKMNDVALSYSNTPMNQWWNSGWPVTVRSSKDPWVVAATTTLGYMTFGGVSDTYKEFGTSLMIAGGVLGGLSLCCCACLACYLWGGSSGSSKS